MPRQRKRRPTPCPVCGVGQPIIALSKHVRYHAEEHTHQWIDKTVPSWIVCSRCGVLVAPDSQHAIGLTCMPQISLRQKPLYRVTTDTDVASCSECRVVLTVGPALQEHLKTHKRAPRQEPIQLKRHSSERWWVLMQMAYEFKCAACGEKKPLTKDHVVPRATGGGNSYMNMQPLCYDCNHGKEDAYIDYRTQEALDRFDALMHQYKTLSCPIRQPSIKFIRIKTDPQPQVPRKINRRTRQAEKMLEGVDLSMRVPF